MTYRRRGLCLAFLLLIIAACSPVPEAVRPTVVIFPTVTLGRQYQGILRSTPLPVERVVVSAATPTVSLAACPPAGAPQLDAPQRIARDMNAAIGRFLTAGGSADALDRALRETWGVMGTNGFVRADLDLTGEGTPEIIVSALAAEGGGLLSIFGCADARVSLLYDSVLGGEPPQILSSTDLNFDGQPELQFASRACADADTCEYRTQVISWRRDLGQLVNLLGEPIRSSAPPRVEDVDQDQVSELVVRFDDDGNAETGPRRTGIGVYDWNGAGYVRALTQLDPPRFRIQVIHLADEAFANAAYEEAISLFLLASTDTTLENWQNDDGETLPPYGLYRILLAYTVLDDDRDTRFIEQLQTLYPDPQAAPVHIQLAFSFWNAYQVTNNLRSACAEVASIIAARPEAVGLLNRYGSESPVYDARTICPF